MTTCSDENIVRLSPLFFQVSYETWTAAECPLRIEYEIEAMREVRRLASGRKGPRGILYGRLDGQTLRVSRVRMVPAGPTDERAWAKLAASAPSGLTPVGLFAVREEVALSNIELDLLRRQFPAPWQIALVMTRAGRAAFFAREYDGTLNPSQRLSVFEVSEPAGFEPTEIGQATIGRARAASAAGSPAGFQTAGWVLAGLIAILLGYLAAGLGGAKRLQLGMAEHGDRVIISWDRAAVANALSAQVEIVDGSDRMVRTLGPNDLASGRLTFARKTEDVSVRLQSNGLDEATRYVGRPPLAPMRDEIASLVQRSAQLVSETAEREAQLFELQAKVVRLNWRIEDSR